MSFIQQLDNIVAITKELAKEHNAKLQDLLKNIQDAANHMHGEWEGGHIRFSLPQDQKRHTQKNYERICKLIKEAYIILDT